MKFTNRSTWKTLNQTESRFIEIVRLLTDFFIFFLIIIPKTNLSF